MGIASEYYPSGQRVNVRQVTVWIDAETLLVWGQNDFDLGYDDLVPGTERYAPNLKIATIEAGGQILHRQVTSGRGYLSQSELMLTVGVGKARQNLQHLIFLTLGNQIGDIAFLMAALTDPGFPAPAQVALDGARRSVAVVAELAAAVRAGRR